MSYNDHRIVCSCWHVIEPIVSPIYLIYGWGTFQNQDHYRLKKTFSDIDFGFLVLDDKLDLPKKELLIAKDSYLHPVEIDIPVLMYGFPTGNPKLQTGLLVDYDAHEARGYSLTFLSSTEGNRYNQTLRRTCPTIRFVQEEHVDSKTFEKLNIRIDPRGFSGGPVFLPNSGNRLAGFMTHCDQGFKSHFFYMPISYALEKIALFL